jgi:Flp pilus assembly protein TadD
MKQRHVISAILLGLFGVILVVYWQTLSADFLHWDDDINVFENPHVQGLSPENLLWMFTDFEQAIRYKALSWLAWGIVHELFGLNPFGFHLANVFLHTMNAWLMFFLILRVFRRSEGEQSRSHLIVVGIATLIWAVHPMRVEPVAWVTGLPYHLALLFILGSTICYLRTDFSRSVWSQFNFQASIGLYLFAAMTYPIVLGFSAVLVALDLAPLRRGLSFRTEVGRKAWIEKMPFLLIAFLMIGGTLYGRFFRVGDWFQAAGTESFTLIERVLQAGYVWGYYVWKPLWPSNLNPLYDTLLEFSTSDPRFLVSTLAVFMLSIFLAAKHRRWPVLAALWIAHLGLLVPMLGLTERPHYPHDRYSILNGILWSIALVGLWTRLPEKRRKEGIAVGLALTLVLGFMSWKQTEFWKNDFTFFTRLAERTAKPDLRAAALMKLGNAHGEAGNDLFALKFYEDARTADPRFPLIQLPYNHGTALLRTGRISEAISQFNRALAIQPNHLGTLNNLAVCHRQRKEYEAAVSLLRRALELAPDNPDLVENLGATFFESGNDAAAEPLLRRSLDLGSSSIAAHRQLAEICRHSGRQELANEHSRIAWKLEQESRSASER